MPPYGSGSACTATAITWDGFTISRTASATTCYFTSVPTCTELPRPEPPEKRDARFSSGSKAKAKALLLSLLSSAQRRSYEKDGVFEERVEGKRYRFAYGYCHNIWLLSEDGEKLKEFCITTVMPADMNTDKGVPVEDTMATQLLLLRSDVKAFYETSNITMLARDYDMGEDKL